MIPSTYSGGAVRRLRSPSVWFALALPWLSLTALPAQEPVNTANYKQATKFSSSFLRKFVYDSSVQPQWIGDSERFWYKFRTSSGTRYWLVDSVARTKVALFDHETLAALLSEACETPIAEDSLDLRSVKFDDAGDEMTFNAKELKFVFVRSTGKLEKKGKAERTSSGGTRGRRGTRGRERTRRSGGETRSGSSEERSEAARKAARKRLLEEWNRRVKEWHEKAEKERKGEKTEEKKEDTEDRRERGSPRGGRGRSGSSFSPDLELYVFAKQHNLYVVKRTGDLPKPEKSEKDEKGESEKKKAKKKNIVDVEPTEPRVGESGGWVGAEDGEDEEEKKTARLPFDEAKALQLTKDGAEDYSFGGGLKDEFSVPARVTWAADSSAFYVTRRDSRGVAELFLVDSLGKPRPTLNKFKYPMPGEDKVRRSELIVFDRDGNKVIPIEPKWKDESYSDVRWLKNGELRVLRRDRLRRNVEYGSVDPKTGAFKALFAMGSRTPTSTPRASATWRSARS